MPLFPATAQQLHVPGRRYQFCCRKSGSESTGVQTPSPGCKELLPVAGAWPGHLVSSWRHLELISRGPKGAFFSAVPHHKLVNFLGKVSLQWKERQEFWLMEPAKLAGGGNRSCSWSMQRGEKKQLCALRHCRCYGPFPC